MNDDPRLPELDDRLLDAVSAVADGLADADERALVDASPDAQRWVEHLRSLREDIAGLGSITPPVEVRESAFAAALAAFDELHAPVADADVHVDAAPTHHLHAALSGATEKIASLAEHRRRRSRWLLSAAAAVVVIAGAGIAIQANRHSDDDLADSAAVATEAPATEDAAAKSAPEPMAAADTALPAAAAPVGAAQTEAADTGAADAAGAAEAAPSTIGSIGGAAEVGIVIDSTDELERFVSESVLADQIPAPADTEAAAATEAPEMPAATAVAASTLASCATADQVVVGTITYLGTQAIAVYDPATSTAIAYDAIDCHVLVTVPVG